MAKVQARGRYVLKPGSGGKPGETLNKETGDQQRNGLARRAVCDMSNGEMKVELAPDAAQWVEAAVASGRFVTAEDAVRYAINRAKRAELSEMLEGTEAEGGSYSTADVRRHVREHLDQQTSSAS